MKKSEKNRNLRLRYLLILLLICAIVFVSSTYAWFTSNKEVAIDTITVNVATTSGIQISADGETWKSRLTVDDLVQAEHDYGASSGIITNLPLDTTKKLHIEPVSSPMTISNGQLDMYYGNVKSDTDGEFALSATPDTPGAGHFIVFDIFLKTSSPISYDKIFIDLAGDDGSGVSVIGGQALGIDNAARVAILNLGTVEDGTDGDTIRLLNGSNLSSDESLTYAQWPYLLWEPNSDTHTASGVANAKAYYTKTIGSSTVQSPSGPTKLPYDAVKTEFGNGTEDPEIKLVKTNSTDNADFFVPITTVSESSSNAETTAKYSVKAEANPMKFKDLKAGITKLRVYMWIEGQDVDCENNAAGTDVVFNLKFKLDTAEETD